MNDELAPLWKALTDPTRREILDLLRQGPRTTGELADAFPTSRFAVMKHLEVLVAAGFVLSRRQGKERWNHLNAQPLQALYERWVRPYEAHWAGGLERLKTLAERPEEEKSMAGDTLGIVQVELEIRIEAPTDRVWEALVAEIGRWWPKDFYAGPAKDFRLELHLGGRMYEDWGNGAGATWYQVTEIQPGRSLGLSGTMPAAFGGPALSLLRLVLRPEGQDGQATVLELTDSEFRKPSDKAHASLDEGWRLLFEQAFKRYVEGGERV